MIKIRIRIKKYIKIKMNNQKNIKLIKINKFKQKYP